MWYDALCNSGMCAHYSQIPGKHYYVSTTVKLPLLWYSAPRPQLKCGWKCGCTWLVVAGKTRALWHNCTQQSTHPSDFLIGAPLVQLLFLSFLFHSLFLHSYLSSTLRNNTNGSFPPSNRSIFKKITSIMFPDLLQLLLLTWEG